MTGTNCDLFTHNQSRSYLNHLVFEDLVLLGYVAVPLGSQFLKEGIFNKRGSVRRTQH